MVARGTATGATGIHCCACALLPMPMQWERLVKSPASLPKGEDAKNDPIVGLTEPAGPARVAV